MYYIDLNGKKIPEREMENYVTQGIFCGIETLISRNKAELIRCFIECNGYIYVDEDFNLNPFEDNPQHYFFVEAVEEITNEEEVKRRLKAIGIDDFSNIRFKFWNDEEIKRRTEGYSISTFSEWWNSSYRKDELSTEIIEEKMKLIDFNDRIKKLNNKARSTFRYYIAPNGMKIYTKDYHGRLRWQIIKSFSLEDIYFNLLLRNRIKSTFEFVLLLGFIHHDEVPRELLLGSIHHDEDPMESLIYYNSIAIDNSSTIIDQYQDAQIIDVSREEDSIYDKERVIEVIKLLKPIRERLKAIPQQSIDEGSIDIECI